MIKKVIRLFDDGDDARMAEGSETMTMTVFSLSPLLIPVSLHSSRVMALMLKLFDLKYEYQLQNRVFSLHIFVDSRLLL